ncbi:hypothetical protein ACPUVO_18085 [Pseudocolwellia sp. HL-MZ19]|uniref:hypothetical protein n=1 Tax=unclassified Pseudocolwellia TaxID=2848178 RepID=UPI003CEBAB89
MALLIILAVIFAVVGLMVVLGERFGKPMEQKQQAKLSKIAGIACFILIISLIVKQML